MTPQERDLLTNLVTRLRQSPPQQHDSEADKMINDLLRDKPDAPYILAQTVLIQDYALNQAQSRIADLEQQLQGQPAQESGGFLSAIFGSGKPPAQRPQPQPYQQPPQYQQPAYQQAPSYAPPPAAGPWGQAPQGYAPQGYAPQAPAQPSFLRSAATTAAGIAGGALLFQGIGSLFGGHGGFGGGFGSAGFGGVTPQPGITETVVNNYYGDDAQPGGADRVADRDDNLTDASFDDGGFDNSSDFGGDDFV